MFDRYRTLPAVAVAAVLVVGASTFASGSDRKAHHGGAATFSPKPSADGPSVRRRATRVRLYAARARRKASDLIAPETKINSAPAAKITTTSASFAFSSSEAGSTFECKLDATAWDSCVSPKSYSSLAEGTHSVSVRAKDRAGNTDASPASSSFTVHGPTSPPPPSPAPNAPTPANPAPTPANPTPTPPNPTPPATMPDGAIPGTGAVLKQDLGAIADPIPLWKKIESAYAEQGASNPQVVYRTAGGDPRPAIGQTAPSPGYRQLFTTSGMQSIYDAGVGNDTQRTQLVSNSDTNTFYPLQPGERYIIYFSVRFEDPAVPASDSLSEKSQVWQIKNAGTSPTGGSRRMIIAMHETRNNLVLERALDNGSTVLMRHAGFERGEWLRFAADIRFSSDPSQGKLQLWGELSGDPNAALIPLTDMMSVQTAYDPQAVGKMSIGPYHHMAVGGVSRDYTNIQVTNWVAP